jgi:hypothetical membrane protein
VPRERSHSRPREAARRGHSPGSPKLARCAAATWLLSAAVYVGCEAVAAVRVPGYSYAGNYISDLGVSEVMNVGGFITHGLLFAAGALVITRAYPTPSSLARGFVLAAAANAAGNILVGTFHSGMAPSAVNWHVIGAGLAIVGGNLAVILGGIGSSRLGVSRAYRRASIALGVLGLASLAVLVADGDHVLAVGVVERVAVYPIIAWELMTGIALLRWRR